MFLHNSVIIENFKNVVFESFMQAFLDSKVLLNVLKYIKKM